MVQIDVSDHNFKFFTHLPFSNILNDLENDCTKMYSVIFDLELLPQTSNVILSLAYFYLQQVQRLSNLSKMGDICKIWEKMADSSHLIILLILETAKKNDATSLLGNRKKAASFLIQ